MRFIFGRKVMKKFSISCLVTIHFLKIKNYVRSGFYLKLLEFLNNLMRYVRLGN